MAREPIVVVLDDDQAVRNALHFTISSAGYNVELHSDAQEFLKAFNPDRPGCLVLDVRMPGMSGLHLQKELAEQDIHLPIIFLTGHGDVPMAVRAMKQGAFQFLEKPFNNTALLDSIRRALSLDAQTRSRDIRRQELAGRLARLKPGEQKVLDAVIEGKTNKEIAARLGMSISTIETRRRRIMEKLRVENLSELVRMVMYCRAS
jgi:RNA polymerase sigma factor (sigma-70 family)